MTRIETIGAGEAAVEELSGIGIPLIGPEAVGFEESRRVFYRGIDRRPRAIVRPRSAGEVASVVRVARDTGVLMAVRSGGHSLSGYGVCDGGIVLDLAALRDLKIDESGESAWAGAGMTAGEFASVTARRGLTTGFGDAPTVGVGGITLGGGLGYLHRRHGLTIDNLLGAEIVTGDGEVRMVDGGSEPELYWAIRGGGGNFGVVTRFHFRLVPVDGVTGGMMMIPVNADLLAEIVAAMLEAPDELCGMLNVMIAPAMPMIPAELQGRPMVMAMLVHCGSDAAGAAALERIRGVTPAAVDAVQSMPYADLFAGGEGGPPPPVAMAVSSTFSDRFDGSHAALVLDRLAASSAQMSVVQIRPLGGAVARVPEDATAFAHRGRPLCVTVGAMYEQPDRREEHDLWASSLTDEVRAGEPGAYVGFMGTDGARRLHEVYPGPTLDRLRRVKTRFDPGNLFRMNLNITPSA